MPSREELFESIRKRLEYLQISFSNRSDLFLRDLGIPANFFRDLLNLVYDWQLSAAKFGGPRSSDIDLIDSKAKIAVQVTASNDRAKIAKMLDRFYSRSGNSSHRLKFVLVANEALTNMPFKGHEDRFDADEDIIDIKKLLEKISEYSTEKLQGIADFLVKSIPLRKKTEGDDPSVSTSANAPVGDVVIPNPQEQILTGITPEDQSSETYDKAEETSRPSLEIATNEIGAAPDLLDGRFSDVLKVLLDGSETTVRSYSIRPRS